MQAEQSWTGKYVLDFGRLLADAKSSEDAPGDSHEENGDENDPDQPVFSFTTGRFRHAKQYGSVNPSDEEHAQTLEGGVSALVLRNQDDQVARIDSAAGRFLLTFPSVGAILVDLNVRRSIFAAAHLSRVGLTAGRGLAERPRARAQRHCKGVSG